jgi:hypothetical protein
MTIREWCRVQRFERASGTLYVGYIRRLVCIDDAAFMRSGVGCALYWLCVVTYTIFGHLRLILKVKKSVPFFKLSLQVQFFNLPFRSYDALFLRNNETDRRIEGRFAVVRYSCSCHCLDRSAVGRPRGGSGGVRGTTVAELLLLLLLLLLLNCNWVDTRWQ